LRALRRDDWGNGQRSVRYGMQEIVQESYKTHTISS
jgi:hypothetical protein